MYDSYSLAWLGDDREAFHLSKAGVLGRVPASTNLLLKMKKIASAKR
jgi:hypothetical protein